MVRVSGRTFHFDECPKCPKECPKIQAHQGLEHWRGGQGRPTLSGWESHVPRSLAPASPAGVFTYTARGTTMVPPPLHPAPSRTGIRSRRDGPNPRRGAAIPALCAVVVWGSTPETLVLPGPGACRTSSAWRHRTGWGWFQGWGSSVMPPGASARQKS